VFPWRARSVAVDGPDVQEGLDTQHPACRLHHPQGGWSAQLIANADSYVGVSVHGTRKLSRANTAKNSQLPLQQHCKAAPHGLMRLHGKVNK